MRTAIVSLTERGRLLSEALAQRLLEHQVTRYCFSGHSDSGAQEFSSLSALTAGIFSDCGCIIYMCACAIAVRVIAPHIRSKTTDPAVIVIGDSGEYVIPILSGHIGRANEFAAEIAEKLGAKPVITTASDCAGLFSPDVFARRNDLIITDMTAAKAVAADIVNGRKSGFVSDYPFSDLPEELTGSTDCRTGIAVSADIGRKPFPVTLNLVPRNIVVGIGCRRGTSAEAISKAVSSALGSCGISTGRICAVSTIDAKADEPGLLEYCRSIGKKLHTWSAEELAGVPGDFSFSAFVEKTVGVGNVCERSAVIMGGRLILPKTAGDAVTVAAAEMPVNLDFGRSCE